MKKPLSIIWTLVEINVVVLILSIAFVINNKQQQLQTTEIKQGQISASGIVNPDLKGTIASYEAQLQEKERIIQQYQQNFQEVEQQLQDYQFQTATLTKVTRLQENSLNQVVHQSLPEIKTPPVPTQQKDIVISPSTEKISPHPIKQGSPPMGRTPTHNPVLVKRTSSQKTNPYPLVTELNPPSKNPTTTTKIALNKPTASPSIVYPVPSPDSTTVAFNHVSSNSSIPDTAPSKIKPSLAQLSRENTPDDSINYANDIAYGLAIAANEGQINHGTKMYKKVQTAIRILRKGESKEVAIRKSKVPDHVMDQLLKWGEQRPGRLIAREIE